MKVLYELNTQVMEQGLDKHYKACPCKSWHSRHGFITGFKFAIKEVAKRLDKRNR